MVKFHAENFQKINQYIPFIMNKDAQAIIHIFWCLWCSYSHSEIGHSCWSSSSKGLYINLWHICCNNGLSILGPWVWSPSISVLINNSTALSMSPILIFIHFYVNLKYIFHFCYILTRKVSLM